ncbi:S24 family peptidase [Bordetella avium]|uniref:S24 family peptidase n=1 Tax=Bordetella avium TaxID=521 RepID=UPI000E6A0F4C|nr:S24 family peptidase [Bordetella avium]RIQ55246.1 S24 family peptidase [Bordetella avium]
MNDVELNEHRVVRLAAAIDKLSRGNKTDFGRRLGYKDGAFVRQMLAGLRPVSEKTVRAIEDMPGMRSWFSTGEAPKPKDADAALPWPFPSIPEDKVRALSPTQLSKLEGALALALGQMEIGLEVSRPAARQPTNRGGLVDMDAAADEFSMRIPGLPPGPSKIKEPAPAYAAPRLSLEQAVAVNVAPGEHHAANDKFEKVPELADVRLAAGEGIENHTEEMTGFVQFRRSFLRSVGADGGRGRVVYAKGDSMEPVIRDGAALLVVPDLGLTLHNVAAGGVYAINYDGKMIVKTMAKDRLTGRWVARSFNARHPDIPLEGEASVRVLGRVVWAGAQLGKDDQGQWVRP